MEEKQPPQKSPDPTAPNKQLRRDKLEEDSCSSERESVGTHDSESPSPPPPLSSQSSSSQDTRLLRAIENNGDKTITEDFPVCSILGLSNCRFTPIYSCFQMSLVQWQILAKRFLFQMTTSYLHEIYCALIHLIPLYDKVDELTGIISTRWQL